MALEKVVYTAHATATGGREGVAKTDDGKVDVKLDPPKEMGGGGTGTNPEQLFAMGYAACFIGALKFVGSSQKIHVPKDASIDSSVSFGPLANGAKGFGIAVELVVHIPGMEKELAEKLVHEAHEVCPYSNATRGNIDVKLSVA
ncbi:peroxiredoxin, Ohr subfamily [Granulicella rosea]|uniref:Peroxiredoxin, Ohr subfamily n=1 Tax=Granulicella rosea TaxID=474952 RepID=A0A239IQX1_9BACT|nr:organic hydroperoxide resistance protein [Granulicella rosea]SNS95945.1 peroxiredoxin, Ohr subfamily [Granulicella rosea]